jgi:AmiR/NasT family two-component response regulator
VVTATAVTPIRILIADDEPIIRLDLRELLTSLGYDVVGEAADGRTAVELARKLKPDLVILDIKMPEVDGIDAADVLQRERLAPVVLLTAYSERELVERARRAGVAGYLVKPFRESEIMPVIELALARFQEVQRLERQVVELQDALEARKLIERAKGILMQVHGLSEAEAFQRMRRLSMDSRKSMREIAEAILLAHQLESSTRSTEPRT